MSAVDRGTAWLRARPWVLAVLGVALMVWGWRASSTWLYVFGVLVTGVGTLMVLRGRGVLRIAAVVALVAVAVGGPWLGVRQAYAPVGVEVSGAVDSYAQYVASYDDVTVFVRDDALVALADDGTEAWTSDLPDLQYVLPVTDDRLVVGLSDVLMGVDDTGGNVWSRPVVWGDGVVATADGVVVLRSCVAQEGSADWCTWTGIEVADGDTVWEASGVWAPGWSADDARYSVDYVRALPAALVVIRDDSGAAQVRAAATGHVVQTLSDDGRSPVLVGDDVLLVDESGECSVELVGDGGVEWTSAFDCEQWRELEYAISTPGVVVGSTFWGAPVEDAGTLVVDLTDGTVRAAGYSFWGGWYPYGGFGGDSEPVHVLGADVEVEVSPDGIVVRDPSSGDQLWSIAVRGEDVRSVQLDGDVLVLSRYTPPLLLHELLAPADPTRIAVEVYDVRTGELRARVRPEGYTWSPVPAGDRVLLDVGDLKGDVTLRMIGD